MTFSEPDPIETPSVETEEVVEPVASAEDEVPFSSLPQYWQEEITRKRKGEETYRTQLREYEEQFGHLPREQREALGEYFKLESRAQQGDQEAIQQLAIINGEAPEVSDEPPDIETIVRQTFEQEWTKREQERARNEAKAQIQSRAERMGYKADSEELILLLRYANALDPNEYPDLLAEADKRVNAYKQKLVDDFLRQKGEQAESSPTLPTTQGSSPGQTRTPWDDSMSDAQKHAAARASMAERFRAALGG